MRQAAVRFGVMVAFSGSLVAAGQPAPVELMVHQELAAGGDVLARMSEVEYGYADPFAGEFSADWIVAASAAAAPRPGLAWESRHRLLPFAAPFNPVVYAKYEHLDPRRHFMPDPATAARPLGWDADDSVVHQHTLETRLVLSQHLGPLSLAANWINDTEVGSGATGFRYLLAAMWRPLPGLGVGLVAFGALGDPASFGPVAGEQHLGPMAVCQLGGALRLQSQLAVSEAETLFRFNLIAAF